MRDAVTEPLTSRAETASSTAAIGSMAKTSIIAVCALLLAMNTYDAGMDEDDDDVWYMVPTTALPVVSAAAGTVAPLVPATRRPKPPIGMEAPTKEDGLTISSTATKAPDAMPLGRSSLTTPLRLPLRSREVVAVSESVGDGRVAMADAELVKTPLVKVLARRAL